MYSIADKPSPGRRGPDHEGDPARPVDPLAAKASAVLWSLQDVAWALGVDRRTVYRMIATGRFPKADRQNGTMPRWKPQTVRDWVDGPA